VKGSNNKECKWKAKKRHKNPSKLKDGRNTKTTTTTPKKGQKANANTLTSEEDNLRDPMSTHKTNTESPSTGQEPTSNSKP
jgi:hypothetical protein